MFFIFELFTIKLLADDFTLVNGKQYKGVTVENVEPDGITVMTDSGIEKLYFVWLPKDVQQKYHYDAQQATAYSAQSAQADQANLQQRQQEAASQAQQIAQSQANADLSRMMDKMRAEGIKADVIIRQVTDDGVLGDFEGMDIFIPDIGKGLIDGGDWKGKIWPAGTYRYDSVDGGTRTIQCFTSSPEAAISRLQTTGTASQN